MSVEKKIFQIDKKEICITSSQIKQAIDLLVNENEILQDKVYKLEEELQQKENIIKEVREYIEEHKQKGYRTPMSGDYAFWNELNDNEIKELLEILDKVD